MLTQMHMYITFVIIIIIENARFFNRAGAAVGMTQVTGCPVLTMKSIKGIPTAAIA